MEYWQKTKARNCLKLKAGDGDRTRDVQLGKSAADRKPNKLRVRACCSAYRNAWSLRTWRIKPWEWSTKGAQHSAASIINLLRSKGNDWLCGGVKRLAVRLVRIAVAMVILSARLVMAITSSIVATMREVFIGGSVLTVLMEKTDVGSVEGPGLAGLQFVYAIAVTSI